MFRDPRRSLRRRPYGKGMRHKSIRSPVMVLQSCPAARVQVNLDSSHQCSLGPWERGQGRERTPGPHYLYPSPRQPHYGQRAREAVGDN